MGTSKRYPEEVRERAVRMVAEVHVKAPNARPISDEASAAAASTLALDRVGWRMFHWLQRSLVPNRSVVD